ncbi:MAG: dnaX [Acidimicrobiaceae bacterium]|nr:MAG: dnaX [Acidimicrobiaceae bacterium]
MATQALYRRYRPQRFSEIRGQEHIVRALRNAVINHREGQAYLFSGPRGTGKTTSARILAKVLNCEQAENGEPCCECDSCVAVQRGTSYDVHELDAASNNGVDAMRDLIEKASLGTPGRHKVYILDEVHMLSKQAEAALLKTLEEPPPHVVFVLATTDPQKVSETIRSRTQHLRFHLLPMDELEAHIRWVVEDAGLVVSEAAIEASLEQDDLDVVRYDEFVEALIEHDPGRALTAVAFAVQQGRDPRSLTEDIVGHLRDCFLSLMAPELVALPDQKAAVVAEQAGRLGAARVVRAMEKLGEILIEMRHAPDARLLIEVAFVQLTHEAAASDIGALMDRIERLEKLVAAGGGAAVPAAPLDPATGRVQLGGGARRQSPAAAVAAPPVVAAPLVAAPLAAAAIVDTPPAPADAPAADVIAPAPSALAAGSSLDQAVARWAADIVPTLKPLVRAIYSVPKLLGARDGRLALGAPNDAHRARCEQHRGTVEAAVAALVGGAVELLIVTESGDTGDDHDTTDGHSSSTSNVVALHPAGAAHADEDIDLDDLVDAPPESVVTPIQRLAQAFPGSELIDERR